MCVPSYVSFGIVDVILCMTISQQQVFFPTIDLIFTVQTWERDGIGIVEIHICSNIFPLHDINLTTYI